MLYQVKRISDKSQIEQCEKFCINKYYWGSIQEPTVYGYMGYLEGQGLFVKMVCEESNPRRVFTQPRDMVCKDSAMEAFLAFPKEGEILNRNTIYTNFEINANGAMYASYGKNRYELEFISEEMYALAAPTAVMEEDKWHIEVLFPESLLEKLCDVEAIKNGKTFYCNFYKVGEDASIYHFGSYSPMTSEHPDFHVQTDFTEAVIV